MQRKNFEDRIAHSQKRGGVTGFVFGAAVLLAFLLGVYLVVHTGKEQPQALVSDAQAKTVTLPIEGMTCASCVARVKKALKSIDGVTEVEVSLKHRHARVRYLDGKVLPEHIVTAINDLGYKAGTPTTETAR